MAPNIQIIPAPHKIEVRTGHFSLATAAGIIAVDCDSGIAHYLSERIRACAGLQVPVVNPTPAALDAGACIVLAVVEGRDEELGTEGYELEISISNVRIRGSQPAGLFYGIQSLLQLFAWGNQHVDIPCVVIQDSPRFHWRGLLLDVARHYMPVDFIKKFIDLLALHKMNRFHWHLVDDQGWRVEIKKYPELTAKGSQRNESPQVGARDEGDGTPYGPYWYSQDEVREIVAYAQERFITVVPEIEMPGHCVSVLSVFPEFSCIEGPFEVATRWGIFNNVYCAGNEAVFDFLLNVLDEILQLFPSEYIHVGGDECPKEHWQACAKCQARIREEGLQDEDELQSYFIQRVEKWLASRGRKLIGWDEILEGGLPARATVMSWRGEAGGIAAAQAGNDVIMCPHQECYLDYYQSLDKDQEPEAIGEYLPLERVYAYDPVPAALNAEQAKHIIGVQGNIWTEYMQDSKLVEYMTFPRACAIAEVCWSQPDTKDFQKFVERLNAHCKRLDALEVGYRRFKC